MISQEVNENWIFRQSGTDEWYRATVPGSVHTDLQNNNLIKDPFFGLNAKEIRWIEKEDWEYECSFNVSNYLLDHDRVEIWFHGLDTFASVSLNGTLILKADNMFRPWNADIKTLIHPGENKLVVHFESPYRKGLERLKKYPYILPSSNDQDENKVSPFVRKAAYQFGWDWAPRLLTSGICKSVEIIAWNNLKIRDFYVLQKDINARYASLACELEMEVFSAGEYLFALFVDKDLVSTGKIRLSQGINRIDIPFGIDNPKLWFPRGYGLPSVYKITIDIRDDHNIIDSRQTTTGIRKVELVRDRNGHAESFFLKVNGKSVYAKGANIVPVDYFPSRTHSNDYNTLVENALAGNMNMLRVWGGASYENDCLYNLCNREGIMIWQDFMFACMMYPSDYEFLQSIQQEAEYNIKRLRNHPSLVLWCGNNEVLEGYYQWGWKEELGDNAEDAFKSYQKVFHEILPGCLSEFDNSRPYWPSSPSGTQKSNSIKDQFKAPDLVSGDYHFWEIIKKPLPLNSYESNIGRFMSEFGFKSYPDPETIKNYAGENAPGIHSEIMEAHQGWHGGAELVERHTNKLFGETENLDIFAYLSQLTQAQAIKIAIEAHRRAKPNCMGSLLWQLNDCWPCASWSAVDYFGKWKALMYELKHLFSDTMISVIQQGNSLQVHLISDIACQANLSLVLRLLSFDGKEYYRNEMEVTADTEKSVNAFTIALDKLNIGNLKKKVVFVAEVFDKRKRLDRNLYYFVAPWELELEPTTPVFEFTEEGNKTMILIRTNKLIKNLHVTCDDNTAFFSDNYFDVLPGETRMVICQSEIAATPDSLRYKSLNTIFNPGT